MKSILKISNEQVFKWLGNFFNPKVNETYVQWAYDCLHVVTLIKFGVIDTKLLMYLDKEYFKKGNYIELAVPETKIKEWIELQTAEQENT